MRYIVDQASLRVAEDLTWGTKRTYDESVTLQECEGSTAPRVTEGGRVR